MSNRPIIGVTVGTPINPDKMGGTNDYTQLTNKPKINGVELDGDKTLEALGIPTGGGEEWEVIATVTLEEDVPIVRFTDLNHKKVFITVKAVGTDANQTTPNGEIDINNSVICYTNVLSQKAGVTRWLCSYVEICGGALRFTTAICNNNSYQSTTISNGYLDTNLPIQQVAVSTMGGASAHPVYMLGKGTEIKIYGVRV